MRFFLFDSSYSMVFDVPQFVYQYFSYFFSSKPELGEGIEPGIAQTPGHFHLVFLIR